MVHFLTAPLVCYVAALDMHFRENLYPYAFRMRNKEYNRQALPLQVELVKLQNWIREAGERVIILFEGRDAAGKGGAIRRFMEHWNPRGARVVALDKPSGAERRQWYFQRYISHFPSAGEIVLFDRSWYNRAGVERVMGFSSESEYRLFIQQTPVLEKMIVDSGIRIIKLYFSVGRQEQLRRFQRRASDPLRQWKVSPVDIRSHRQMGGVHRGQGVDVPSHPHGQRALDYNKVRRQKARPHQRNAPRSAHPRLRGKRHVGRHRSGPLDSRVRR